MAPFRALLLATLLSEAAGLRAKRGDPDDPEDGHYGQARQLKGVLEPTNKQLSRLRTLTLPNNTRFLIYYVLLPANRKHPSEWYRHALQVTCRTLRHLLASQTNLVNTTFGLVGSAQWVSRKAPDCQFLIPPGSEDLDLTTQPFSKASAYLWHNCSLKFGPSTAAFPDLVQVWLNKLPEACSPYTAPYTADSTTVVFDAGLMLRSPHLFEVALESPKHLKHGKLAVPHYTARILGHRRMWFGQKTCRTAPFYLAMFMTIRMRDCSKILSAFEEALSEMEQDKTCGCFDEEMVLTKMGTHPPMKALIHSMPGWTQ